MGRLENAGRVCLGLDVLRYLLVGASNNSNMLTRLKTFGRARLRTRNMPAKTINANSDPVFALVKNANTQTYAEEIRVKSYGNEIKRGRK